MSTQCYRPILRFKRGEQRALDKLSRDQKAATKPLLNITRHSFNPTSDGGRDEAFDLRISQDARRLNAVWAGYRAAVDFGDLDPDARCDGSSHPVCFFFDIIAMGDERADVSPVLRLGNDDDYVTAVASVCNDYDVTPVVRLTPDDIAEDDIEDCLKNLMDRVGVVAGVTDVVVDLGYIPAAGRSTITALGALPMVPFLKDWATVSLVAGSFPENLSGFSVGTHTVERYEWAVWLQARKSATREVLYGDYATIHPKPVEEGLDPRTMNPSASVRYTVDTQWVLVRGSGTRTRGGGGFDQFYDHADEICAMPEYRGETFSYGDEKVARICRRHDRQGNLETWVTIGVNHHIAEIVSQLASLS